MDKIELGSKTAKNGFKNEIFVIETFNNWQSENLAQEWLKAMAYNLNEIERVEAQKIKGSFKADIQVVINVSIKLKKLQDVQNIQVKLVSNLQGFNQIDKRYLQSYEKLWNIPSDVLKILQYFVGEKAPKINNPKDERRMFFDEFEKRGAR
ncbi:hypothetical protein [Campylobacter sp. MIT 99-7217]|uniref:hypothetical protein n=1 Tax=Campylobacter sp. MIT 99-7217 TaxID=535091 RepID=UPI0028A9E175|nr:hypothetical protein [Campylobacter sp. MIT 99-7217]